VFKRLLIIAAGCLFSLPGLAQALEPPSLERGEELWGKCKTCHTLEPNGRNLVGPRLHGMFGRQAGAVADFRYSETMKKSGVTWTDANLDAYLAATQDFMPGNKMYGGLAIAQDRADLLFWLKHKMGIK
jgi:cytochrome c